MNKIINCLKDFFPILLFMVTGILIFFLLPALILQGLIILNICFSLCLFLSRFIKSRIVLQYFAKLVLFSPLITSCQALAVARSLLSIESLNNQLPIVIATGQFICREQYVCGFFTSLMLCSLLIIFCKKYICKNKINNADVRSFIKARKNSKTNKINVIDYYAAMGNTTLFLSRTITVISLLFVVILAGGTLIGILDFNLTWKESLNRYMLLSSSYLVLFVLPLFLTALGFNLRIQDRAFVDPDICYYTYRFEFIDDSLLH